MKFLIISVFSIVLLVLASTSYATDAVSVSDNEVKDKKSEDKSEDKKDGSADKENKVENKTSQSDDKKKEEVASYEAYLKEIVDFEKSDKFQPEILTQELPLDADIGDPKAPIKVVEYASLGCIHCKQFHQDVFYELKKNYIDTGKVFFKFRNYPLNAPALKAALIKECLADKDRMAYVGAMFESQAQWAYSKSEADLKDKLKTISKISGLSDDDFEKCYNNEQTQNVILDNMKQAYDKLLVNATPTIFINGKRYMESRVYEGVSKYIDNLLAGSSKKQEKPESSTKSEKSEDAK